MPLQFLDDISYESEQSFAIPNDLTVAEAIQSDILYCAPDTPLNEVAASMQERQGSSILIMDGGRPIGIWTERDALAIDYSNQEQLTQPICNVMSQPVVTIRSDTLLRAVAPLFRQHKIRHFLVVCEDEVPLGILSQTDVVVHQGIEHYLHLRTVGSVVRKDIPRLDATALLPEAVRSMQQYATDAVLVTYPDDVFGIFTERDLVSMIANQESSQVLGEIASRPLQTVPESMSLYQARNLLAERQIRRVGVSNQNELLGLVSYAEIMLDIEVVYVHELQQALHARDRALSASRRNLRLAERIIENTLEGVIITDAQTRILSVNPAFTEITGYTEEEVLGKTPRVLSSGHQDKKFYQRLWHELNEHGQWQGEIWNRKKNGELLPEFLSITAIYDEDGKVSHYAAMFNDITKLKENEENIRNMAYRDPLTSLPNRRLLDDRLDMAIAQAHRQGGRVGVIFIDLDNFKHVNDSLGHAAGDEMLEKTAQRLERCVRENDTVARLGGDEFVVVLSDPQSVADVHNTGKRIVQAVRQPLWIQGQELIITCSLGISIYPENGQDRDTLLRHADAAMYQIKANGRDGLSTFTSTRATAAPDHLSLIFELRRAIEHRRLALYYQPLMDSRGRLAGAEALLRWYHPTLGQIPPDQFIPLAEDSGLIIPLGEFVLREAVEQQARWDAQGLLLPEMAVNISGRQLRQQNFIQQVGEALDNSGISPERLVLELTESVLMDEGVSAQVAALKAQGVQLALDDFGTGYGALTYLKRFPFDRLKIDRSFVHDMLNQQADDAIVSALAGLAKKLDLQVVAEGVEHSAQLEALRGYGCDFYQGYLFAPALPASEFTQRFLE